jgi:carbamoyl-phosphate synthase large subunit
MCYEKPYINDVIENCRKHAVEYIIPINDAELPIYAQNRKAFEEAGFTLFMNPGPCVRNSYCKEKSWRVCEDFGIRQPMRYFNGVNGGSRLHSRQQLDRQLPVASCFPLIAKPPVGVGGRGQVICEDADDVERLYGRTAVDGNLFSQYIWQQYINGEEYSVDCLGKPHTDQFVAVPRTRGKIINGQATGGMTRHDPEVVDFVRDICKAFGSTNVCCVQVIREQQSGKLYFIELNPRYGTGVSLSFEAGIDFLDLQMRQNRGWDITEEMLTYQVGVGMARHWQECYYRDKAKTVLCGPT